MTISQEQREFFTQKNPAEEFDTITFNHPEFKAPLRLVLNQFRSLVFAGNEFIPVAAKIKLPDQGSDLMPKLSLQFSRIHVGDEFKKIINSITPFGWQEPISMIYEQYNELSMNKPVNRYSLYVSEDGVRFNRSTIQVTACDDNPMVLSKPRNTESNPIYTLEEYRGLANA
ncbi:MULTISPECIES: hypothetical protein [unclassified Gilliamella]|nr:MULTISPECIES: hypothetical protein [unclassified Gilliamella]MCX8602418.1 hypothetical protein [Gilliamella sp. B3722]MCX8611827.1 hypothetical protein [Gilliamella sp. B3891]MCX8614056.1 hypothetical protein [Gilliamella sp. B3773]MCX8621324.1 hypothetical protein [Gilliamella sp. B3892]MCX8623982.1 hypothetical protein [Gilliamella sp. B3759]